ncbi:dTDP-4-amino-4,6-dideoxygalactose transaminase [Antrihabitans sp. YC3-6]|uniref:dTDP-4-amino-4,6-dideoxygalactose transaminase n=1 Tax=Antrihabitans stalagmiti TaxID=2799499 RepID=A0A934NMP1_9NOCA|nr:dTDP-4-amino-4,6-dideoxygalactose transaminase [Antrihabitans stalagmiti]MBJ8338029.1 dTDP-4-amino-4,6-dideoxygalactose transaminase [Antrihabitans stalagmiti]
MNTDAIPFNKPFRAPGELDNLGEVLASSHVHGDGRFTNAATAKLKQITHAPHALLTTSCTHALELGGLLLELQPGDEVILPSFTFPSPASSVALRGATCVFVDIDDSTGNIDPAAVAEAITEKTKAVVVMHYGGVAADMGPLLDLAAEHCFAIVEDNAHGLGGSWQGRPLGTIGTIGALSFHDTKNVHAGEGGALLLSDDILMMRAEIMREKGTDRARFLRGEVDKYGWQDIGSSYLPSELNAAVLDAQLASFDVIQAGRHRVWDSYARALPAWAQRNGVRQMNVPADREHTAHLFYLRMPTEETRDSFIGHMRQRGIATPFHYVPLGTSPAGSKMGRTPKPCVRSAEFSETVVRLPIWPAMTDDHIARVLDGVTAFVA